MILSRGKSMHYAVPDYYFVDCPTAEVTYRPPVDVSNFAQTPQRSNATQDIDRNTTQRSLQISECGSFLDQQIDNSNTQYGKLDAYVTKKTKIQTKRAMYGVHVNYAVKYT